MTTINEYIKYFQQQVEKGKDLERNYENLLVLYDFTGDEKAKHNINEQLEKLLDK